METTRRLGVDIVSELKNDGFTQLDQNITKSNSVLGNFAQMGLGKFAALGAGFLTISKGIEVYKKSLDGAKVQFENEFKIDQSMKAQGYSTDQIDSIKKYASNLQDLGVVGDEVSLAGMTRMASFKLEEKSIRELTPAMQNLIVYQKGLNGTTGDAISTANLFNKAMSGQSKGLEMAGVKISDYDKKILKTGTESQKVKVIIDSMNSSIGNTNEEMLKTPWGKIQSVENRIGDVYEEIGFKLIASKAKMYGWIGDNLDAIRKFVLEGLDSIQSFTSSMTRLVGGVWKVFKAMPDEVQTAVKLVTAFAAITTFPIAGIILVVEDIWTAFEGGESVVGTAFDSIMKFLDIDYSTAEAVGYIKGLWGAIEEGKWVETFIGHLSFQFGILGDSISWVLKSFKNMTVGSWEVIKGDKTLLELSDDFNKTNNDTLNNMGDRTNKFVEEESGRVDYRKDLENQKENEVIKSFYNQKHPESLMFSKKPQVTDISKEINRGSSLTNSLGNSLINHKDSDVINNYNNYKTPDTLISPVKPQVIERPKLLNENKALEIPRVLSESISNTATNTKTEVKKEYKTEIKQGDIYITNSSLGENQIKKIIREENERSARELSAIVGV